VTLAQDRLAGPETEVSAVDRARARLVSAMPGDLFTGWLGPALVALFAFLTRLYQLDRPGEQIFDEVYYRCDAKMLWEFGYEHGHTDPKPLPGCEATEGASFVVHPPLGKWLIGLGQYFGRGFGNLGEGFDDPWSFRIAAAVAGALSVLIVCRAGRRLFRSTLLGCVAGLLLTLDGLHFVQSRIAMVDIFLLLFVVAAFAALLVDRDDGRRRLAERLTEATTYPGPSLGFRPWRLVAGIMLGCAMATKWSALFVAVAFTLMALAWDAGARRTAGIPRPLAATFWRELGLVWVLLVFLTAAALGIGGEKDSWAWIGLALAVLALGVWRAVVEVRRLSVTTQRPLRGLLPSAGSLLLLVVLAGALTYTASWTGWFVTDGGWRRTCVQENAQWANPQRCGPLKGWWEYHREAYDFHDSLDSNHPYQSSPWGWQLLAKPVSYHYVGGEENGTQTSEEVLGIGTPAIWWAFALGWLVLVWQWAARRDWRAGAILVGYAAAYLPWFATPDRTMFLFYALPAVPFMCLGLAYCVGLAMKVGSPGSTRRSVAIGLAAVYLALVVVNFVHLLPILTAETIPYESWRDRIWFNSWI
jgi:dolichyl-phosphate-mannose-protein mannosyltransferase